MAVSNERSIPSENTASSAGGADQALLSMRSAAAEDLRLLAFLHSRELDAETLADLSTSSFSDRLGLVLDGPEAREAFDLIDRGLVEAAEATTTEAEKPGSLDAMAADYADIYVTHQLRASPLESVWLDVDKLILQGPMFEIRGWYEHYGLKAKDWRCRSDDHLALQLEFIAFLLERPEISIEQPARFMDEHLLRWIDPFSEKVAGYCEEKFYAGLAVLTASYLGELRDYIETLTGYERRVLVSEESPCGADDSLLTHAPYVPGMGPVV